MRFIADFHVHSRYSRATSTEMEVETLARWAALKGIKLLGTGDFTHPTYFAELSARLEPAEEGLFRVKKGDHPTRFMLTGEVSNIYHQSGKLRKIHTLIFGRSLADVERLNAKLQRYGKLSSDGRPIFTFSAKELVKMVLEISPSFILIPAHAWTPWFSVFGANSGFDSLEECFEETVGHIWAIETGLSSDPQMNWRLSKLDKLTLISNSDAHSPSKIGREANVFDCELSFSAIRDVIKKRDAKRFLFTIEFFPEEGKYHYDGHRKCGILFAPAESRKHSNVCPVCKKLLTIGVCHRVEELADREPGFVPKGAIPARHLIPLGEIIGEALGVAPGAASVEREYMRIVQTFGSEFDVLLDRSVEELSRYVPKNIVDRIRRVREGKVKIVPGHDGVFGKISIVGEEECGEVPATEQMSFF
ncbi:MAG: endonuclease Q family protein [Candidatus Eisenbacteria bacterium]|nr:endonuclease Q family protein [Candidatus Eisenbacteria bacterium]